MRINREAVKAIRERSGLTGTALATEAGISQSYMNRIESGEKHPTPKVADKIARALKVPLVAILADPNEVAS